MVTKKPDPKKGKGKDKKKVDKTKMVMKKIASGGSGSKAKKKKWSKGKVRDKLENQVFLDQPTYDKAIKEIAKMILATPAIVSERYKLKVSVAKKLLMDAVQQNLLQVIRKTNSTLICTRLLKDVPATA
uniref:40S ribosomal protein S25 n=1 Tax=Myxobolus squamalis TaxID=59785 RepID=A0A6B2GCC8_MYXSQ